MFIFITEILTTPVFFFAGKFGYFFHSPSKNRKLPLGLNEVKGSPETPNSSDFFWGSKVENMGGKASFVLKFAQNQLVPWFLFIPKQTM